MTESLDLSALIDRLAGPAGQKLSLALLHFLWQGVLIAAGAAVLMRLCRRSPQRRYAIGVAGMVLMAVAPFVTFCVVTPPPPASPPALADVAPPDELLTRIDALESMLAAMGGGAGETGDEVAAPAPAPAPALTWPERVRLWQPYALLLWLGGTGLFALRLGVGVRASRRFGRGRRPLPEAWLKIAIEVAGTLGIKTPRVFVSDRVVEAVAVGLLRPMVLIPAAWLGRVPPEVLEAVLAHELAHLRRYDLWVNLLQRCVEAALFYHPAVWWLSRRVRVEREYCCDETAATAVSGRAAYARALEFAATEAASARRLAAMRPTAWNAALAAGMGGEPMALLNRVRRVLGADDKPPRGNWVSEGLLALAVPAALWVGIATVGPAVAGEGERGGVGEGESEGSKDVLIFREVEHAVEGDVMISPADVPAGREDRDVLIARDAEAHTLETYRVPILGDLPLIGRLFTNHGIRIDDMDIDVDGSADVLITRNDSDDEDSSDAEEEENDSDDVREALSELRSELKALRSEVRELRAGHGGFPNEAFGIKKHPLPPGAPMPPKGPMPPGALHVEKWLEQKDGPPRVFLRKIDGKGPGPERFEVRVFRHGKDEKGPGPEQFIKRLHVENMDGKPQVFLFREGEDGQPEKVQGKFHGDESVIELDDGRLHVRPLPPEKSFGPHDAADPRDEVIRDLKRELEWLRKQLEASRSRKVGEADRMTEMMARQHAEAAKQSRRAAVEFKLDELRREEQSLKETLGDRHPKRQTIEKAIRTLEEAREELENSDGADADERYHPRRDAESLLGGADLSPEQRERVEEVIRERVEEAERRAEEARHAAEAVREQVEAAVRQAIESEAQEVAATEARDEAERAAHEAEEAAEHAEAERAAEAAKEDAARAAEEAMEAEHRAEQEAEEAAESAEAEAEEAEARAESEEDAADDESHDAEEELEAEESNEPTDEPEHEAAGPRAVEFFVGLFR